MTLRTLRLIDDGPCFVSLLAPFEWGWFHLLSDSCSHRYVNDLRFHWKRHVCRCYRRMPESQVNARTAEKQHKGRGEAYCDKTYLAIS